MPFAPMKKKVGVNPAIYVFNFHDTFAPMIKQMGAYP